MLAFTWPINNTPHNSDLHIFYTRILITPDGHLFTQVGLDLLGKLLKNSATSTPATWARHNHRCKCTQPHRLQNFLGDLYFFGALTTGFGSQGNTYGIANALLKQHRQGSGRSHNALTAHTGLGKPQM